MTSAPLYYQLGVVTAVAFYLNCILRSFGGMLWVCVLFGIRMRARHFPAQVKHFCSG